MRLELTFRQLRTLVLIQLSYEGLYQRQDLNLQGRSRGVLKPLCIPIPPRWHSG